MRLQVIRVVVLGVLFSAVGPAVVIVVRVVVVVHVFGRVIVLASFQDIPTFLTVTATGFAVRA
jgi:hypothetical protein